MKPRHGAPILLLLAACVGVVTHARAQLGQELWQLGDELAALAGSGAGQSSVTLNGAQIELVTLTIPGPVKRVLDRFDALCAREAPALTADVSGHGSLLRQESSTGGVAVCLAQPADAGLRTLSERARDYARTRDLSLFGQLRYVRAQRTATGAVHVLMAHSHGPLRLSAMFPAQGDAAGSDFAELPRPRSARRLLSAQVSSAGQGLVAYVVQSSAASALSTYARELERNGFVQLEVAPALALTRTFTRSDQLYVVHGRDQGTGSVLSAVRIGRGEPGTALAKKLGQ